ncbi:MAG TPA: cupin domain-containing protein [Candidatus Binatia bacterium]|nr:cupin domain-containing protein [Candidatus Binatia bacterium]
MESSAAIRPYRLRAGEGEAIWFLGNLVTVRAGASATRGRISVVEFVNPAGFGPPLHRHRDEDEMFHVLSGAARVRCDGEAYEIGPGDFVFLPAGLPHTFLVGQDAPLHVLQITAPGGFEAFAAAAGKPARERRLPDPGPVDPARLAQISADHGIEILGPPPSA